MPGPDGIILGFDPGGKNAFGWSVCVTRNGRLESPLKADVANSANDALSARDAVKKFVDEDPALQRAYKSLPLALTPPCSGASKGDRKVDGRPQMLKAYQISEGSRGGLPAP